MRTVRTLVCIVLIAALLAGASGFRDVPAGAYYAQAVAWAVEHGVTTGTSPSTFSPNRGCTRAQVVTFLYRSK